MEYLAVILFAITTYDTRPNNTMLMTSGSKDSAKPAPLPGHHFGFSTMVIAVVLGLATLFDQIPLFHVLLKITGVFNLSRMANRHNIRLC